VPECANAKLFEVLGGEASRRRNFGRHSTVSWRQVCSSGRVCRRTRPICSNMLWFRTRPTARFCVSPGARVMPVLLKLLRTSLLRLPRPALRSEQIKLQVALITPLIHVKG
jgi:hypothetical protein